MWGWKTMYVFQWFCMWSYDGIKLNFKKEWKNTDLKQLIEASFLCTSLFPYLSLIICRTVLVCLCYSQFSFLSLSRSLSLTLALSVLGRVFLPRPLMAFFSASSIQAWPSPLKNTSLSLVPLLATTQVQGWWTSILRTHFLYVRLWIRSHLHHDWQWF